jgi:hypothetical protein
MTDLTRDINAECVAEKLYTSFICELNAVAKAQSSYCKDVFLTDIEQDHEVGLRFGIEGSVDYWHAAYGSAANQAGWFAEDYGFNLNAALGRIVY